MNNKNRFKKLFVMVLSSLVILGCNLLSQVSAPASKTIDAANLAVTNAKDIMPTNKLSGMLSPDGNKIAVPDKQNLCIYTLAGEKGHCITGVKANIDDQSLRWAPDGSKIVFTENYTRYMYEPDIWVYDTVKDSTSDLTNDGVDKVDLAHMDTSSMFIDIYPTWSSDGKTIIFLRYIPSTKKWQINSISAQGGEVQLIKDISSAPYYFDWSTDGKYYAYNTYTTNDKKVFLTKNGGGGETELSLNTDKDYNPYVVRFSADSRYLMVSYLSTTVTAAYYFKYKYYLVAVDGSADPVLIEAKGAAGWAPSGSSLVYLDKDQSNQWTLNLISKPGDSARTIYSVPSNELLSETTTLHYLDWSDPQGLMLKHNEGTFVLLELGKK